MTGLLVVACALVGLAVGSFLNVVIWRVPREESVVRPRSHCPACGAQLAERDNIPVVSWLLLRGRCRSCGQRISARYPLVELLAAVVFVATAVRFGADWVLPAYLVFFAGLVALSAIDLDLHRLPNRVLYPTLFATAPLLVLASAAAHRWGNLARAAEGGVLCFAILLAIHLAAPRGMGFGDGLAGRRPFPSGPFRRFPVLGRHRHRPHRLGAERPAGSDPVRALPGPRRPGGRALGHAPPPQVRGMTRGEEVNVVQAVPFVDDVMKSA